MYVCMYVHPECQVLPHSLMGSEPVEVCSFRVAAQLSDFMHWCWCETLLGTFESSHTSQVLCMCGCIFHGHTVLLQMLKECIKLLGM